MDHSDGTMYNILNYRVANRQNNFICPQVEHMGLDYRWNDLDSVTKIILNRPLKISPNMRAFCLDDNTNVTDLISQGYIYSIGLLASGVFCDALADYVVQAHETYRAEVVYYGISFNYNWLHMIEEVEERIDYLKTTFSVRRSDGIDEAVDLPTLEALCKKNRELVDSTEDTLVAKKIVFLPDTRHYDLFCLRLTGQRYFVSDRLADELVRRRLTGFELTPSETVINFQ